jgi:hypothetical protein
VDDVLRFGARVQAAHRNKSGNDGKETEGESSSGSSAASSSFPTVQICVIPKVSHAYLHVVNFLPEAKLAVDLSATWLCRILGVAKTPALNDLAATLPQRMKELDFTLTDCKDYQLHQPMSQAEQQQQQQQQAASNGAGTDAGALLSKL